jgi:hypothetical protein
MRHAYASHCVQVFDAGSAQMKQAYNTYARIDYLRPYFDVEPKTVRNRLLQSLVPRPAAQIQVHAHANIPCNINTV